jgi:hypothetical protein
MTKSPNNIKKVICIKPLKGPNKHNYIFYMRWLNKKEKVKTGFRPTVGPFNTIHTLFGYNFCDAIVTQSFVTHLKIYGGISRWSSTQSIVAIFLLLIHTKGLNVIWLKITSASFILWHCFVIGDSWYYKCEILFFIFYYRIHTTQTGSQKNPNANTPLVTRHYYRCLRSMGWLFHSDLEIFVCCFL